MAHRVWVFSNQLVAEAVPRRGLTSARTTLEILVGFVGLTAATGAVFIVPDLSTDWFRFAFVPNGTVPAVVLGVLSALSFSALYGLLKRRKFGGLLSIATGASVVLYELAESFLVGSLLTPPAGVTWVGYVVLVLQLLYIAVGLALVILGGRLSSSSANRPHPLSLALVSVPARTMAVALLVLTIATGSLYGWAAASTGTSMYARFLVWGDGTTYNWSRFPSRPLPAATSPDYFAQAPGQFDLAQATGSINPDQFFTSSDTTALLVIQNDKLVLERYYNGANRSTMITAYSDTKSWDSAMVGAAIAAGYIHSLDDPVTEYIPELARKDPRFNAITLRDLLSMRSDLAWNTSGFPENDDSVVGNTTALRQAVLDRVRIVGTPGTTFLYNDFNPLLLGIVLERATGTTVTQWLDRTLWGPMGAQYPGSFSIDSVAGGFERMASGLNGTPIDLIRLGVLYLHDGNWNEAQLVPGQWVAQSTDYSTAGSVPRFPGVRYGMGWWTRVIDGVQVYYAWGDHGEYVMVVPSLNIVVARFGRQYGFNAPRGTPQAEPRAFRSGRTCWHASLYRWRPRTRRPLALLSDGPPAPGLSPLVSRSTQADANDRYRSRL